MVMLLLQAEPASTRGKRGLAATHKAKIAQAYFQCA